MTEKDPSGARRDLFSASLSKRLPLKAKTFRGSLVFSILLQNSFFKNRFQHVPVRLFRRFDKAGVAFGLVIRHAAVRKLGEDKLNAVVVEGRRQLFDRLLGFGQRRVVDFRQVVVALHRLLERSEGVAAGAI